MCYLVLSGNLSVFWFSFFYFFFFFLQDMLFVWGIFCVVFVVVVTVAADAVSFRMGSHIG